MLDLQLGYYSMSKHLHRIVALMPRDNLADMGTGLVPLYSTTVWGQASPAKAPQKRVPARNELWRGKFFT